MTDKMNEFIEYFKTYGEKSQLPFRLTLPLSIGGVMSLLKCSGCVHSTWAKYKAALNGCS